VARSRRAAGRHGETAASVDIQQDIFKPDPGHAALDQPTQGPQFGSDSQRIGTPQTQLTLIDAGKAVSRQTCVSAWKKDPIGGVIGVQKGPL
jgi:hypothetical protein